MIAEYIKREALMDIAEQQGHVTIDDIIYATAADVVEVVRCGECKFFESGFCFSRYIGCGYVTPQMTPNDFCSHGERRDKE